jgi:hypothetical protein
MWSSLTRRGAEIRNAIKNLSISSSIKMLQFTGPISLADTFLIANSSLITHHYANGISVWHKDSDGEGFGFGHGLGFYRCLGAFKIVKFAKLPAGADNFFCYTSQPDPVAPHIYLRIGKFSSTCG